MYRSTTMYPAATSSAGTMIIRNDRFIGSPVSRGQLRPGPVLRPAGIRLPQDDVRNLCSRRQTLQLPRDFVVKIFRNVFRRRIHGLKGLKIVHELVVEPGHDLANNLLELREVHQYPHRIERWSFEPYA